VEAEYDRLAAFYDRRWRQYVDATLRIVEEAVECEGHERMLDAPCGTGELERRLLLRWPSLRIVGVDVSREMVRQADAKDVKGSVRWLRADVRALPLADEIFDWVFCANSFHYFPSPLTALGEFRRVLRPGGRVVLVDWCDDYLTCKLCSLWLRWTEPAYNRTYSLRSCRSLLEQAGLLVEDMQHFRVGWIWGLMRFVCRRPEC
jgi:ubiquinone/menaquinone biosynthesis C-methylase UbiE